MASFVATDKPVFLVGALVLLRKLLPFSATSNAVRGVACAAIYPFLVIVDAGFVATTVNYLWSITAGLFCLLPVKKALCRERCPLWIKLMSLPLLCYACNMQQMSAVLLAVFLVASVFLIVKKAPSLFVPVQTVWTAVLTAFSLHLNTAGAASRVQFETERFFPTFADLGVLQKVELGFSSTFLSLTAEVHFVWPIFLIFTGFLAVTAFKSGQPTVIKTLSLVPTIASLLLGILSLTPFFGVVMGDLHHFRLTKAVYTFSWSADLIFVAIAACVIAVIWTLAVSPSSKIAVLSALLLGAASRVMMGFSPTVWASGHRTFDLLLISFVFITMILVQDRYSAKKEVSCDDDRVLCRR